MSISLKFSDNLLIRLEKLCLVIGGLKNISLASVFDYSVRNVFSKSLLITFHYINLQTNNRQLYELTLSGDQRERFNKLVRTLGQS